MNRSLRRRLTTISMLEVSVGLTEVGRPTNGTNTEIYSDSDLRLCSCIYYSTVSCLLLYTSCVQGYVYLIALCKGLFTLSTIFVFGVFSTAKKKVCPVFLNFSFFFGGFCLYINIMVGISFSCLLLFINVRFSPCCPYTHSRSTWKAK